MTNKTRNELKLSLENFQSISTGELVFEPGLNFIIGQSNSGKTATFRALKACLSNPSGSQRYIKEGTKQASVNLVYNGNDITWIRTPKESKYIINGETYLKTGKASAFTLVEDTGFSRDSNDVIMNIEEELQLPYPFGITSSELFKLYENVFCVSDSAVILKSAKEHEDKVKFDMNSLETEFLRNKTKLEELESFKKEVDFNRLEEYKERLKSAGTRLATLKEGQDIIKKAVEADKVDFSVIDQTFENKLIKYKELVETKKLIKSLKELHALGKSLKELSYNGTLDISSYKELISIKKEISKLKEFVSINPSEFEPKNVLEEYFKLNTYRNELRSIKRMLEQKELDLAKATPVIEEIQAKLKEYKVCPLCHHALEE